MSPVGVKVSCQLWAAALSITWYLLLPVDLLFVLLELDGSSWCC